MKRLQLLLISAVMLVGCGGTGDTGHHGADEVASGQPSDQGSLRSEGTVISEDGTPDATTRVESRFPGAVTPGQRGAMPVRSSDGSPQRVPARVKPSPRSDAAPSAESRFLQGGALSAEAFGLIDDGPEWRDAVAAFENDGLSDPDANDLHTLFGDWLRTSLGRHGLQLGGFGCGKSLCAATIPLQVADARARFDNWRQTDASQPPMPLPVFAESVFTWPEGQTEMRILFSTDPAVSMIRAL